MSATVRRRVPACVVAAFLAVACDPTGSSPLRTLVVTPNPITLQTSDTLHVTVVPLDGNGNLVLGVPVVFESADTSVAVVSNLGTVTARRKGTTTIVVSSGEDVATLVPSIVTAPIIGMFVSPSDTTIRPGTTAQLRAGLIDAGGDTVSGTFQWTSFDTTIARVSSTGLVTSRGPIGTAPIGVSSGYFFALAYVTVPDSSVIAHLPLDGRPVFMDIHGNTALISRVDRRVEVMDLATTRFVGSIAAGLIPCGVVFNNAGTTAYVANQYSDNVGVLNVAGRTQSSVISLSGDPLPVEMPPSDSVLFVTTNVNRLFKIDTRTNTVADSSLPLPATSHHLVAHPNDTLLYVATRDGGTVMEVNWRTMTILRTFPLGGRPQDLVLSPDNSELYVANEHSNAIHTITLATGAVATTPMPAGANTIELGPDGTRLYVGLLFAGRIEVLDRATRAHIKTIVTGGVVREMRRDIPRNRVIVTNEAGWIDIVR